MLGNAHAVCALWMGEWWWGRVLLLVLSVILRLSMIHRAQGLLGTMAALLSECSELMHEQRGDVIRGGPTSEKNYAVDICGNGMEEFSVCWANC